MAERKRHKDNSRNETRRNERGWNETSETHMVWTLEQGQRMRGKVRKGKRDW